jgi:hypothetical protein
MTRLSIADGYNITRETWEARGITHRVAPCSVNSWFLPGVRKSLQPERYSGHLYK